METVIFVNNNAFAQNRAKVNKRQKRNKKTGVTTKQKEKIDALSPPRLFVQR